VIRGLEQRSYCGGTPTPPSLLRKVFDLRDLAWYFVSHQRCLMRKVFKMKDEKGGSFLKYSFKDICFDEKKTPTGCRGSFFSTYIYYSWLGGVMGQANLLVWRGFCGFGLDRGVGRLANLWYCLKRGVQERTQQQIP
jgi:hypothetical protein